MPRIRLSHKPRHLRVQPANDVAWSRARCDQREPGCRIEAGQRGLRDGGNLGRSDGALRACDGERAQRPCLHVANDSGEVCEDEMQLTTEEVVNGRRLSAIGHVHHLDAGLDRKKLTCHVRRGAESAGAEIDRAWAPLGPRDEIRDRLGGH